MTKRVFWQPLYLVIYDDMHLFDSLIVFQFIVSKLDKLYIFYNLFVFYLEKARTNNEHIPYLYFLMLAVQYLQLTV